MADSTREFPSVSVLMTAYNREKYIGDSIASVLAQRYSDFELLIVDDCSTDGTLDIARDFEKSDTRVRVVVNERNLGDYPNRNRAASLARGALIKYHDSDDVMYAHCLATMVPPMLAEKRAAIGISLAKAFTGGPSPMLLTPRLSYQREFLGQGIFMGGPACGIFRRAEFLKLGAFPERGVLSDFVFWLSACARVNVLTLPGDLFWYRVHPGQEAQSATALEQYTHVTGEEWKALHSPNCPLDDSERERAKRTVVSKFAKAVAADIRGGRIKLAAMRYKHSGLSPSDIAKYLRRPRRGLFPGTPLAEDGDFIIPTQRNDA
ncbi:MAG TPA: glycosyltransferase family A protein [Gemmatimonadaceae bacterium]|nr:glycosyltransferase family A protein [Gemmatimonadaceae bacterium]